MWRIVDASLNGTTVDSNHDPGPENIDSAIYNNHSMLKRKVDGINHYSSVVTLQSDLKTVQRYLKSRLHSC